ncbi:peptidoglycan DD-metalloendopeptidase family protein [Rhodoferax sp. GW822-FHT02A01]|uniref:peptidoglycan DD-metalloendopeptidase family protein n=1 Tax=Rhodoferax sp. GW822-FHT02A01 TaxID=3141537 RepID=UPI00315CA1A6
MSRILNRAVVLGAVVSLLSLAGCGSSPMNRAPVEDRGASTSSVPTVATAVKPPPGFENAGKPGYYTVKPGDTLIRIGLDSGQSNKDIARWNNLDNPNHIEVGQVLRVVPPTGEAVVVTKPVTTGAVTTTPIATPAAAAASAAASAPAKPASAPAAVPSTAKAASAPASAVAPVAAGSDEDLAWIWPAKGVVVGEFDEAKNKGVDISGAAGDPVLASADGKVVYAGAGLRGYGNLIILKHNNTFLTAYAHNQSLLVKEDQVVKKGQKIAEMGNSDADKVKLHFEVRRQGKPVDPLKYLPAK